MKRRAIGVGIVAFVWLFLAATASAHNYADTVLDSYASEGTFEVGAYGDTWFVSPSDLGEFLTGVPADDSFVRIPDGDYIILGFEGKTVIDGPGDDLIVHAATRVGAVDVYGFVNAFDWDRLVYLGEARATTSFDLASAGIDSVTSGDRVVAVKIEGQDGTINRPFFQLHAIEISPASVGSTDPGDDGTSDSGRITGGVSDAETELPLSNVEVSLYDMSFTELMGMVTTPDSGYFEFDGLLAGEYNLRFFLDGYDLQEHSASLSTGDVLNLDIALDPTTVDGSAQVTVVDSVTEESIGGAEVFLVSDASGDLFSPTLSDLGIYVFEALPPGAYGLTVTADGYVEQSMDFEIVSGETSLQYVALEPVTVTGTGTVFVTVKDSATNALLSDADVLFYSAGSTVPIMPTEFDGDRFVFTELAEGVYTLSVSMDGYERKNQTLNIPSDASISIDLYLDEAIEENTLVVSVQDSVSALSLESATVAVYDSDDLIRTLQTGRNGRAFFEALPLGMYNIRVFLDGYIEVNRPLDLEAGEPLQVDISLEPAVENGSILVMVNDAETLEPLENVNVFIGDDALSGETGTDGRFTEPELDPGFYVVNVLLDGYLPPSPVDVEVIAGRETEVSFSLEKENAKGTVRGGVFDESLTPLSSAIVVLKQIDGSQKQVLTSDEGMFRFNDVDSGEVEIQAIFSGYLAQKKNVEVEAGGDVIVDFILQKEIRQGAIMGRVLDKESGDPVEGALVRIVGGDISTTTSRSGDYIVREIPSGDVTLTVSKSGYETLTRIVALTADSVLEIDFDLVRDVKKGSVSGRVIDAIRYSSVNGAMITISSESGFDEIQETLTDGLFSFSNLTPGTYSVAIEAPGFESRIRDVLIAADIHQSVIIKLTPKAPEIIASESRVTPAVIVSGLNEKVTFLITVHDPDGVDDIIGVFLSHPSLNASLIGNDFIDGVAMTRIPSSVDIDNQTIQYEYSTSLLGKLPPKDYAINVTAQDRLGFQADHTIQFSVIQKNQFRLMTQQMNQTTMENTMDKQSLVISITVGSSTSAGILESRFMKHAVRDSNDPSEIECPECYVEVRIYRPDGTLYNTPYIVCDSKDITIPDAEAGAWTYETTSYCPTSLDIEVETRGAGTAFLTGLVKDADTGLAVSDAMVRWSLGGETSSSETGYFSTIVLPGEGVVTTTSSNYKVNLRGNIVLTSTERKRLDIALVPESCTSSEPVPDRITITEISEPQPYPDAKLQPFAAGVIDSDLIISALFPPYDASVSIYLGISSEVPAFAPYFFLFNTNDELIVMEDVLVSWRVEESRCQWQQVGELLSLPIDALPPGKYTFYSLVTSKPETLETYDLRYFTLSLPSDDEVQE